MAPNPLLIKLFCLLSVFFVLQSCSPHEPGTWKNDKIESSQKEDFHALNKQLLDGLKANAPRQVEAVMSQVFIEDVRG